MGTLTYNSFFTKSISLIIILTFVTSFVLIDFTPAQAGFLGSIGKAISGVAKGIGGAISGVAKGIGSVVGGLTKGIGGAISGITKGVGGFLSKAGSFIKGKVLPFVQKIAPIVAGIASIAAPYLAPAFQGIAAAIGTGAKIASSVCTLVKSKGKNLLGAITGALGAAGGPLGGIVSKIGGIAGKISSGISMIKSGNFGGLLSAVGGIEGMPFADTLKSLGSATTGAGNGFKGLLSAVGGKIMNSPIAKSLMGTASKFLGGVKASIPGIAGNLKGMVGKITGMMTSGANGSASGILGKLGELVKNSGIDKKAVGFIDGLAEKMTGSIDGIMGKITGFNPDSVTNKLAAELSSKFSSKIDSKIGSFQQILGKVQAFSVEAQSSNFDIAKMTANAEAAIQRTGPNTVLSDVLGQIDFSKYRAKIKEKIEKIDNEKVRKYAEKAFDKLPPDMKLKEKIREELNKWLN